MADPQDDSGGSNRSVLANGVRVLSQIATSMASIAATLLSSFPSTSGGTAATATGGAATLPANPVSFLVITMPDGSTKKVALYDD